MQLSEISKAVSMYNMLHADQPLSEAQAGHLLQIWQMVTGTPAPVVKPEPANEITPTPDEPANAVAPLEPKLKEKVAEIIPESKPQDTMVRLMDEQPRFATASDEYFRSTDRTWQRGYEYHISVTQKHGIKGVEYDYWMNYSCRPTQEQFNEHYELHLSGTHNVHVHHRWLDKESGRYIVETITDEYCSWRNIHNESIACKHNEPVDVWSTPLARWRIRYKDSRNTKHSTIYYSHKPSESTINLFQQKHAFAVSERRPAL